MGPRADNSTLWTVSKHWKVLSTQNNPVYLKRFYLSIDLFKLRPRYCLDFLLARQSDYFIPTTD